MCVCVCVCVVIYVCVCVCTVQEEEKTEEVGDEKASKKRSTKVAMAKRMLKKGIIANTRLTFDDDGNVRLLLYGTEYLLSRLTF